jgi:hypothetical protein
LESDASDFTLDSEFSQYGEDGQLHPIAYRSRKFFVVEINYEIHDKELLAIIDAFEKWRHLLKRVQHIIIVYMDDKNLEYFISARVLNRRQAKWSISLSQFDFMITYCPSNLHRKLMPSCNNLIWHQIGLFGRPPACLLYSIDLHTCQTKKYTSILKHIRVYLRYF